jgi:hypothetical protein
MADTKISALTASTVPLAGTEVLPIVQSGVTKQVSVANLTAGRAISATQMTLTTGNLIVASGQGIDFSATPGTGTSELLADYEEGDWTPTDASGAGLTLTVSSNRYTKIGRQVTVTALITYPSTASGAYLTIGGLPFTSGVTTTALFSTFANVTDAFFKLDASTSTMIAIENTGSGLVDLLNSDVSSAIVFVNITYFV